MTNTTAINSATCNTIEVWCKKSYVEFSLVDDWSSVNLTTQRPAANTLRLDVRHTVDSTIRPSISLPHRSIFTGWMPMPFSTPQPTVSEH